MRRAREERDCGGAGVELIDYHASLAQYPPFSNYPIEENTVISLGDLHGNALKLLYFLIRENILLMDELDYYLAADIYYKPVDELTRADIGTFRDIINRAKPVKLPKNVKISSHADDKADRGSNDYFSLLLDKKISQLDVEYDILFSNHGYEFLRVFEQGIKTHTSYMEKAGCATSLSNFRVLIEKRLVSMREVNQLVKKYYLPHLRLLTYIETHINPGLLQQVIQLFPGSSEKVSDKALVLCSHAGVGLKTVVALKRHSQFRAAFTSRKRYSPQNIIDAVNQKFSEIVLRGLVVKLFSKELETASVDIQKIPFVYAILRCIWSRGYQQESLKSTFMRAGTRYHLFYVHGHDGAGRVPTEYEDFVVNLDNRFGKKHKRDDVEKYSVLYTKSI